MKQLAVFTATAPWAPGLHLAFGKWQGTSPSLSPLATGSGADPISARLRCQGEMAENLALVPEAHPGPVFAKRASAGLRQIDCRAGGTPDLGSEGAAAHPDGETARLTALCERVERAALALWAQNALPVQRLAEPAAEEARYRLTASHRRARAWEWVLLEGVSAVLVVTDDGANGALALGTAAALTRDAALDGALREAMVNELLLLAPPEHPDQAHHARCQSALQSRLAELENASPANTHRPAVGLSAVCASLDRNSIAYGFADLSLPQSGAEVWRFLCPQWPMARNHWPPE